MNIADSSITTTLSQPNATTKENAMNSNPATLDPTSDFQHLLQQAHPGPGTGACRQGSGPGHTLVEIATVIAVCLLLQRGRAPMALNDLVASTKASAIHKRLNALGDASGRRGLDLDRADGNAIAMTEANRIRAALWLRDHNIATAGVAAYFDHMLVGANLLAFIGVDAAQKATANAQA